MKTPKDLELAILDMLREDYCSEYIGRIKVIETFSLGKHLGYVLKLGLNKDEKPLAIAMEGSDDEFLKFVHKELCKRKLNKVEYYTAIQIYRRNEEEC